MEDYLKYVGTGALTFGAISAALLLSRSPQAIEPLVDLNCQSTLIPGKDQARKSCLCTNGKLTELPFSDVQTLHEAFKRGARVSNNGRCLGWRPQPSSPYKWISYNDVFVKAANIGAGLIAEGQKASNSTFIGIYSQNTPEYFILEQACYMYSMVLVPLYDTLGPDACTFIINQAEINVVFCDKLMKVKNILKHVAETPLLKSIVCVEEIEEEMKHLAVSSGVNLIAFQYLEKLGEKNPEDPVPCKPEDLSIICYTSGTTGQPKGAMLTHKGTLSTVAATLLQVKPIGLGPDDVMISYLPLAHSYERFVETCIYTLGGSIGFYQGDIKKLMDDVKELKPTLFPSVPRLLNRMYDKIREKASSSWVKSAIFNFAMSQKEAELKRGIARNNSIWDLVVFRQIQQSFGGRTKLISTGSAPLSPKVLSFLRCVLGCSIIEGYGQTENHAITTLQHIGDVQPGQVGPPLACSYVKLIDVPEMNYYAKENQGEICVMGPNVFKGYLKDEEKTREVLDNDGWLHTGDIGEWLSNGTLKIIDRKKNIFKLAQGEYIAPEKIENIYIRSPLIAQVFVHGDSLKASLVAVCVLEEEVLMQFAQKTLGLSGTISELSGNLKVQAAVLQDLTDLGKKAGLASFEQVKGIYLHAEPFSIENGLLTPTMKSKRQELKKYFSVQIENMYSNLA